MCAQHNEIATVPKSTFNQLHPNVNISSREHQDYQRPDTFCDAQQSLLQSTTASPNKKQQST